MLGGGASTSTMSPGRRTQQTVKLQRATDDAVVRNFWIGKSDQTLNEKEEHIRGAINTASIQGVLQSPMQLQETARQRQVRLHQVHVGNLQQFIHKQQKYHDDANSSMSNRGVGQHLGNSSFTSAFSDDHRYGGDAADHAHTNRKEQHHHPSSSVVPRRGRSLSSINPLLDSTASSLARPHPVSIPKPLYTTANALYGKVKGGGGPLSAASKDASAVEAAVNMQRSGGQPFSSSRGTAGRYGWRDGVSRPSGALDSAQVPMFSCFSADGVFAPDTTQSLQSMLEGHRRKVSARDVALRAEAEDTRQQCVSALSLLSAVMMKSDESIATEDTVTNEDRRQYFTASALRGTQGSRADGVVSANGAHLIQRGVVFGGETTTPHPPPNVFKVEDGGQRPYTQRPESARGKAPAPNPPSASRPASARVLRSASILTAADSLWSPASTGAAASSPRHYQRRSEEDLHEGPYSVIHLATPPPTSLHRHSISVASQQGVFIGTNGAVQTPQTLPFRSAGGSASDSSASMLRRRKSSVTANSSGGRTAVDARKPVAVARKSFAYQLPSGHRVVAGTVVEEEDDNDLDELVDPPPMQTRRSTAAAAASLATELALSPERSTKDDAVDLGDNITLTRSVVFSGVSRSYGGTASSASEDDAPNADIAAQNDEFQRKSPTANLERVTSTFVSSDSAHSAARSHDETTQPAIRSLKATGRCVTSLRDAFDAAHQQ